MVSEMMLVAEKTKTDVALEATFNTTFITYVSEQSTPC